MMREYIAHEAGKDDVWVYLTADSHEHAAALFALQWWQRGGTATGAKHVVVSVAPVRAGAEDYIGVSRVAVFGDVVTEIEVVVLDPLDSIERAVHLTLDLHSGNVTRSSLGGRK